MKLRSRATGEIKEAEARDDGIYLYSVETEQWFKYDLLLLAEYWEYCIEPKEPLIKDSRLCKIVRDWYEYHDTNRPICREDVCTLSIDHTARIEFWDRVFADLDEDKIYTIAELCGESDND